MVIKFWALITCCTKKTVNENKVSVFGHVLTTVCAGVLEVAATLMILGVPPKFGAIVRIGELIGTAIICTFGWMCFTGAEAVVVTAGVTKLPLPSINPACKKSHDLIKSIRMWKDQIWSYLFCK
jgi:hypothetical protein